MFRISKLTDYATSVLALLAEQPDVVQSATDLAERARLELPTVSKLLKALAQAGLVASFRGANGGYRLARPAEAISVADIIAAIEGPIGVTECNSEPGVCAHEPHCGTRGNWRRVSEAVEATLRGIRLTEMQPRTARRRAIPSVLAG